MMTSLPASGNASAKASPIPEAPQVALNSIPIFQALRPNARSRGLASIPQVLPKVSITGHAYSGKIYFAGSSGNGVASKPA